MIRPILTRGQRINPSSRLIELLVLILFYSAVAKNPQ